MKTITTKAAALVLALVLGLTAQADEKKLIEKNPPDKAPTTDQEFLTQAISCTIAEIKCSEYVAKNAINEDVKKFAQKMVEDHTRIRDQLLERAKDLKVAVVEGLEKEKQEKFDQLKKLKGSDFDREYLRCQVEGHEKALRMFERWAERTKDEKLRDVVRRAIPTMKDHLEHARKLHSTLKG